MLIQLLYSSKATTALSPADLTAILDKSVANNQARQITGLLLYRDGCFLQLLEGEEAVVEAAFSKISQDPRHHQVESLFCSECKQREFGQWYMGFHVPQPEALARFPQFAPVFDPAFEVSQLVVAPQDGLAMLKAFAELPG
ncbi:BLUF domain-containing protein [Aquitalea sp. ASV11]|uniref:BLUF domain-containing protein n=1 Tax=Aquitalea sp. ASV11 TaxID=2795103 RepID=UPI0018EA5741|nr:BLUF domain-containing protein [Aquitalea sp. ASV11]